MRWFSDRVYAILGSHGLVKVGYSVDPFQRMRELQTGSPFRLSLAFEIETHGRGRAVEEAAHELLGKHRQDGEWFAVPVEVAVAAISAAAYRVRVEIEEGARRRRRLAPFAILAAAFTPVWLSPTPLPLLVVVFAAIVWLVIALMRNPDVSLRGVVRWAAVVAAAIAASIAGAGLIYAMSGSARADDGLPDGFIDSTNASIKTGRLHVEADEATVNFTVVNTSKVMERAISVECTALIDGEPVETNAQFANGVAPGETAYGQVNFFKVGPHHDATATCRVSWIRTKL